MTDKFDNGTNNKNGIKSDRPGRRAGGWDDFLADFKNEDDIEVHSLEDLGIDDDFDHTNSCGTSDLFDENSLRFSHKNCRTYVYFLFFL